jgi:HEAT repeat protein
MSTMICREGNTPDVKVARAVASVRRAIGGLVRLLGDEDFAVVEAAIPALVALGAPAAVGPLAAALPRAPTPRHRGAILTALVSFAGAEKAAVVRALIGASRRETDLVLATEIRKALMSLMMPAPAGPTPGSPGA